MQMKIKERNVCKLYANAKRVPDLNRLKPLLVAALPSGLTPPVFRYIYFYLLNTESLYCIGLWNFV